MNTSQGKGRCEECHSDHGPLYDCQKNTPTTESVEKPESQTPRTDACFSAWNLKVPGAQDPVRLMRELEKELTTLESQIPLSSGKTRNTAAEMLGEVLRHIDDPALNASHGCVEVTNARSVVDGLIGQLVAAHLEIERLTEILSAWKLSSVARELAAQRDEARRIAEAYRRVWELCSAAVDETPNGDPLPWTK